MTDAIVVEKLSKTYQVPEREGGFKAAVSGFFHRKYRAVHLWVRQFPPLLSVLFRSTR